MNVQISAAVLATVLLSGLTGAQTVVDSMSYGDNSIQWNVYNTDGAVAAFIPKGGEVWFATSDRVGIVTLKTGAKRFMTGLGSLPSEGVNAMTIDNAGTIWFATANGLASTTGSAFKVYTTESGLPSNTVQAVHAAANGTIWAGTDKGAAALKGGSFTVYTTKEGLSGDNIRAIVEDVHGAIWFATNRGISSFNGSSWTTATTKQGLSSNDVRVISYDNRKDVIWAAVGEMDVNSWDGKEWKVYMQIEEGISCIMTDTQSRIWFGNDKGVIKFNGFEWVMDPQKIGFPAARTQAMHRDARGDLWFGLETGILHMKNPYPF